MKKTDSIIGRLHKKSGDCTICGDGHSVRNLQLLSHHEHFHCGSKAKQVEQSDAINWQLYNVAEICKILDLSVFNKEKGK